MGELYKLPNGEWIDLAEIVRLIPIDAYKATGTAGDKMDAMPRCVIVTRDHDRIVVECSDWAGAQHLADELGQKVNEARKGAGDG